MTLDFQNSGSYCGDRWEWEGGALVLKRKTCGIDVLPSSLVLPSDGWNDGSWTWTWYYGTIGYGLGMEWNGHGL